MANLLARLAPRWAGHLRPVALARLMNPTLVSASLALLLLFFSTLLALRYVYEVQERIVSEHLQGSLSSFTELIQLWHQQNSAAIHMLADSSQGRELLPRVLAEQGANPETLKELRDWLYPVLVGMGFDGYSVINPEREFVAVTSAGYQGQSVSLAATHTMLDKTLGQKVAISAPVPAPRPLHGPLGDRPAGTLMQNLCVALTGLSSPGSDAPVNGFFCLRFNTQDTFIPVFLNGRRGATGEIYAIDYRGAFVTPPRFEVAAKPLQNDIQLEPWQSAPVLNTAMANRLTQARNSQVYVALGYQDYRAVAVAGAGRWLEDMELGIIVEQDMDEAMAAYIASRRIIVGLSLGASLLIVLLTLTAIINRGRLAAREGRFRSLLDNLPQPIYMTSLNHRLIVVNPAFCQLLGMTKAELLGRDLGQLSVPAWLRPLLDAPDQGELQDQIIELRCPEGKAYYYRLVRFPVMYQRGATPQASASVWVDSTERVVANQQLAQVNQNLEQLVQERTSALLVAKDEALAASHSKAEFLANMSHEIRTPLNAIIGLAHIALDADLDSRLRTYLEKMRASGEHLLHIINDILNFSRMEAGKLSLDQKPFSPAHLVDKTLDLVFEKAMSKGLKLSAHIDPEIPAQLLGDELRLGQILINFCANAVKFTDQGQVTLQVTLQAQTPEGVSLLFAVQDTGIGIAAEQLTKLFRPFEQVDSSSARRFEGTGLGLSICKKLAELMHAQIQVQSSPGQGCCFSLLVTLGQVQPPSRSSATQRDGAAGSAPVVPSSARVLVVEDNLLNQEIIHALLVALGVQVVCVDSGAAALAELQRQRFDLVFMDIQLPGMDGIATTQAIRELEALAPMPIVALTANALPGDKERYLAAGMDDYLPKPIVPAQLQGLLQRWLPAQMALSPKIQAQQDPFAGLQQGGIDTRRALHQLLDNTQLYRRLLVRFAAERAELVGQLHTLIESDPGAALNQIHSLKSLAGSLGMNQLEQLAQQLEQLMRANPYQPHQTQRAAQALVQELGAMVALVHRELIETH